MISKHCDTPFWLFDTRISMRDAYHCCIIYEVADAMWTINSQTFALMLHNIVQLGILLPQLVGNLFQREFLHHHLVLILPNIELQAGYLRLSFFPVSRL